MRASDDGTLRLSPTDLANHLACAHLTQLELRVQRGRARAAARRSTRTGRSSCGRGTSTRLRTSRGSRREGLRVVRLKTYDDEDFDADEARRATEEAIRSAEADVIYQAYLTDGTWRGFADFLVRLPDGTYEPVDTKLARSAKPLHAIQLCFYAEQLERIQGRLPEHVHVELGSGERATLRTADFIAFFRRSRERLLAAIEGGTGPPLRHARDVAVAGLPLHDLRLPPPLPGPARRGGPPDPRRGARAAARGAARRRGHPDADGARGDRSRHDRSSASGRRRSSASARRPRSSSTSRAPASGASSCCRTRRTAASARFRRPRKATSGSTSRATRSTSRRAGSSTSSAGATGRRRDRSRP